MVLLQLMAFIIMDLVVLMLILLDLVHIYHDLNCNDPGFEYYYGFGHAIRFNPNLHPKGFNPEQRLTYM